jgi:Ni,Fe-hydrogenase III large subunit
MSTTASLAKFPHTEPIALADVPALGLDEFRSTIIDEVAGSARLFALFGRAVGGVVRLYAVLGYTESGELSAFTTDLASDRYPSLTPDCPQAHWFEREVAEQWGVVPEGHPWLKPIRFHHSYRPGRDAWGRPGSAEILPSEADFFRMEGAGVHEVAVGPIHAGVIEPGHFRFQCHGERVFHLEVSLGFQHRGIERALVGGPTKRTIPVMEGIAGDTVVGHTSAYCQAVESLSGVEPPLRAQALRGVAMELERLANHTGDLGALANDVGFLPTASYCGRLRGDFLNSTAEICGSRFGRCLVRPGGVLFDVEPARAEAIVARVEKALADVRGAAEVLWDSVSVQARFEGTGAITREIVQKLGLVGIAARACGSEREVRRDFPTGIYRFAYMPVAGWPTGDVFARAYVRWLEIERSCAFVTQLLRGLPGGATRVEVGELRPDSLAVAITPGWRGRICHVAITDEAGKFALYKVVDPSFFNWAGLMMALRDQPISDFPLCNKSFNLSYCGHDL